MNNLGSALLTVLIISAVVFFIWYAYILIKRKLKANKKKADKMPKAQEAKQEKKEEPPKQERIGFEQVYKYIMDETKSESSKSLFNESADDDDDDDELDDLIAEMLGGKMHAGLNEDFEIKEHDYEQDKKPEIRVLSENDVYDVNYVPPKKVAKIKKELKGLTKFQKAAIYADILKSKSNSDKK